MLLYSACTIFAEKKFVMAQQRRYPLGIQHFPTLREEGRVYVDKTEQVYKLTHLDANYVFISRPRRFGKSLLTSTLRTYFEGRRDLFKGLAIEKLETEWTEYPVLQFEMNRVKHPSKEQFEANIGFQLSEYEKVYGKSDEEIYTNDRLYGLIKRAYEKTGKKVVVLIDEYDAPLLDVVHEEENLPVLRNVLQNFYCCLKPADPYLRFVFLTGITKFSQLSIFSALNNIKNVSMDGQFADICGITAEELTTQMLPDIDILAGKLGKSREETIAALRRNYDGYHFTWPSPDIYNPYSLLNAFSDGKLGSYWFGSGTPTYLIQMLRKYEVTPQAIGGRRSDADGFDAPTEMMTDITPLLYQSGYITIKDYYPDDEQYLLDLPNREVRIGLTKSLLPNYVTRQSMIKNLVVDIKNKILRDDMDGALELAKEVLSNVPYCKDANTEGHYQSLLYLMFTLLGYFLNVEVRTADGRIDIVIQLPDRFYIIELKLHDDADTALKQISVKRYADRFTIYGRKIVKVGIGFDVERHTLRDWKIES